MGKASIGLMGGAEDSWYCILRYMYGLPLVYSQEKRNCGLVRRSGGVLTLIRVLLDYGGRGREGTEYGD